MDAGGASDDDDDDATGPAGRRRRCPTSGCRRPSRCSRRRSTPSGWTRLRDRMDERGYDHLVVWADREHSANLAYLTGFDPRFEEAVLVVGPSGDPALLVGNECFGTAEAAPLPMRCVRFQDLSLPGQPRDASPPLAEILGDEGIGAGTPGRRRRLEDVRRPRHDRGAGLPRRRAAPGHRTGRARGERHRPASSTPPTGCASSTRSSSWPRSSGRRARRRTACAACSPGCGRA